MKGKKCQVKISSGGKSRSVDIDKFPFIIGRGDASDLKINSSGVSRSHVSVSFNDNSLAIEDLSSSNGTFLNGKKLSPLQPVRYKAGDAIKLGLADDILTLSIVGDVSHVESSVVKLPPLPAGKTNEPPKPPPPALASKLERPPLESTMVDPNFHMKKYVSEESVSKPNLNSEALEEARAAAFRIKMAAETEAAKIVSQAKEKSGVELHKAKEKADEIIAKATDQAYRLQKEGEAESGKLRKAMQETIANLQAHAEEQADEARRDAREKGEKVLAGYQSKAEKILGDARLMANTTKAEAQKEAEEILRTAYQKSQDQKNKLEAEFKVVREAERKKSEEAINAARAEADKILSEARGASAGIRHKLERELEENRKRFQEEAEAMQDKAEKIFDSALRERDALVRKAQEEKTTLLGLAEAEAVKIREAAEKEIQKVREEAQNEALSLQHEAEKVLKDGLQEVIELKKAADLQVSGSKAAIEKERTAILARVREQGEIEKKALLEATQIEAEKIKQQALKDAKKDAANFLKMAENDRSGLNKAIEKLQQEALQLEKKKVDLAGQNKQLQTKLDDLESEIGKSTKNLALTLAENQKTLDEVAGKIAVTDSLLIAKRAEVESHKAESKKVLDAAAHAEKVIANLKSESEKVVDDLKIEKATIQKDIEDLKARRIQLDKDVTAHGQAMEAEKARQKQTIEVEIARFKDETTSQVKQMREKASSDFESKKAEQDAELSKMRLKELDIIKNLRKEEDAEFKASRKHHVLEIAKALETYIIPRVKEALNWGEVPKSLNNFFPEVKEIVGRVLDGEFSEVTANTSMDMGSPKSRQKAKNKKSMYIGASLAVAAVAAFIPFRNDFLVARKPASEIFADKIKEKELKKPKFNPSMTEDYKNSYAENVLYTKGYLDFKLNSDNQGKWITDLNKFFENNLGLNENAIVKFISLESSLVGQLKDLRALVHVENQKADIQKMTDLEKESLPEMISVLGSDKNYAAFRQFEKEYIEKNRIPASVPPQAP